MTKLDRLNEKIRNEWNALGFYYDRNDKTKKWQIAGSKNGIIKFCELLENYSKNSCYKDISQDEHFGPYQYLKFMTWDKPIIAKDYIAGRQADFQRLSEIIKKKLEITYKSFVIDKEYANENQYVIEFIINETDFIPSSSDSQLLKEKRKDRPQ